MADEHGSAIATWRALIRIAAAYGQNGRWAIERYEAALAAMAAGDARRAYALAELGDRQLKHRRLERLELAEPTAAERDAQMRRAREMAQAARGLGLPEHHQAYHARMACPSLALRSRSGLMRAIDAPPSRLRLVAREPDAPEPSDRRESIRRHQPGQRRGPPPPDPEAIAQEIAAALVAPLTRMIAMLMAPAADDWIGPEDNPLPPRIRERLGRELRAKGDERAAKRGRSHLLKQSAIDEYLRGAPQPKRAAENLKEPTAGERLLAEIGGRRG